LRKLSRRRPPSANPNRHRLLLAVRVERTVQAVVIDLHGKVLARGRAEAALYEKLRNTSEGENGSQAELFGLFKKATGEGAADAAPLDSGGDAERTDLGYLVVVQLEGSTAEQAPSLFGNQKAREAVPDVFHGAGQHGLFRGIVLNQLEERRSIL